METTVTFISVVRDKAMYEKCITSNPFVNRHTLIPIDNTNENRGIPFRYNQFLNSYDYAKPTWFVFCHEDFEFQEDIYDKLCTLDTHVLYGPIGAITKVLFRLIYLWKPIGSIMESNKDGTGLHRIGSEADSKTPVETFDCSCLIAHSDLIQKYNLRFDEQLSFDLYVEDFCIAAHETHHIPSQILSFKCRHWSGGNAGERFYKQLSYLNSKYTFCCYTSLCAYTIGKPNTLRWLNYALRAQLKKAKRLLTLFR
jgi:hypothetical protein